MYPALNRAHGVKSFFLSDSMIQNSSVFQSIYGWINCIP